MRGSALPTWAASSARANPLRRKAGKKAISSTHWCFNDRNEVSWPSDLVSAMVTPHAHSLMRGAGPAAFSYDTKRNEGFDSETLPDVVMSHKGLRTLGTDLHLYGGPRGG